MRKLALYMTSRKRTMLSAMNFFQMDSVAVFVNSYPTLDVITSSSRECIPLAHLLHCKSRSTVMRTKERMMGTLPLLLRASVPNSSRRAERSTAQTRHNSEEPRRQSRVLSPKRALTCRGSTAICGTWSADPPCRSLL
jgi:hypothetical protein